MNQQGVEVAEGSYQVESIDFENYDDVPGRLQRLLDERAAEGYELVSCLPIAPHFEGELHRVPMSTEGSKPYDDVWNEPTGPHFLLIFKRP